MRAILSTLTLTLIRTHLQSSRRRAFTRGTAGSSSWQGCGFTRHVQTRRLMCAGWQVRRERNRAVLPCELPAGHAAGSEWMSNAAQLETAPAGLIADYIVIISRFLP